MSKLRLRYQTLEIGRFDVHLKTLRDKQQFQDEEGEAAARGISSASWPLFGVVWPSSVILAHHMLNHDIEGKRILEVGCGIGLTSILLNQRHADITAMDQHPQAQHFLRDNVALNEGHEIPFVCESWDDEQSDLGVFDLIVGSDVLYEREHVALLSTFLDQHSEDPCEILIVDPGRGHHASFSKAMIELGFEHSQSDPSEAAQHTEESFRGKLLTYHR